MVQQLSSQHAPACLSFTHAIVFSNFALEYMRAVEQQSEGPSRIPLHPDMIKVRTLLTARPLPPNIYLTGGDDDVVTCRRCTSSTTSSS